MSHSRVGRLAAALARCRLAREVVAEATVAKSAPATVAEAYDVQRALHADLRARGVTVVGQKIGCTTAVMQDYLNIPHPCAGGVYDRALWRTPPPSEARARPAPHSISRRRWHRLGLECEIAVVLRGRLGPGAVTRQEAAEAVGTVHAAVELVDDRYEDFARRKPAPLCWVADDFFHAGLALGPPLRLGGEGLDASRLDELHGEMRVDDAVVGAGSGSDIIDGHPLEALRWLASSEAAPADGLAPGWIVSLGSVCRTHWLEASESEVRVSFSLGSGRHQGSGLPSPPLLEGGFVAIDFD